MFLCKRLSTFDTMLSRFNDVLQTAADVVSWVVVMIIYFTNQTKDENHLRLRNDINRLARN